MMTQIYSEFGQIFRNISFSALMLGTGTAAEQLIHLQIVSEIVKIISFSLAGIASLYAIVLSIRKLQQINARKNNKN